MGWSTEVKLWLLSGAPQGQWPKAEARLIDHQLLNGLPIEDLIKETVDAQTAATWQLAFQAGPSWPADPAGTQHFIALTVEDEPHAGFNGLWFRTTALETLPPGSNEDPNGYLEIILSGPIFMVITGAQPAPPRFPTSPPEGPPQKLQELFAAHLPIRLDGNDQPIAAGDTTTPVVSTVEGVTLSPTAGGTIAATFTGISRKGPGGASIDYTLMLQLAVGPTQYPFDLNRVIDVQQAQGTSASFEAKAANSTIDSRLKATLANLFSGVILEQLVPELTRRLSDEMSAAVIKQGAALFGPNQTTLPPGVTLACRDLVVDGNGIIAHFGVGAFGGVTNKFPKSGGGSSCALSLATLALPAAAALYGLRRAKPLTSR